jgi:hypothetical protein
VLCVIECRTLQEQKYFGKIVVMKCRTLQDQKHFDIRTLQEQKHYTYTSGSEKLRLASVFIMMTDAYIGCGH